MNRRQVEREEKEEWINGLAEIYSEQGYKIRGKSPPTGGNPENEIVTKIAATTGLAPNTVMRYLDKQYKQTEFSRTIEQHPAIIPASQRIESTLGSEVKERFEEEVKQKLKEEANLSPEAKKKT